MRKPGTYRFGAVGLLVVLCVLVPPELGAKGDTLLRAKLTILRELDVLEGRAYEDRQKSEELQGEIGEIEKRVASIRTKTREGREATGEARARIGKLLRLSSVLRRQMGVDILLTGADLQQNLRVRRLSAQLAVTAAHRVKVYLDREVALNALEEGLNHISARLKGRLGKLEARKKEADASKRLFLDSLRRLRDDPRLQAALTAEMGVVQASLRANVARYETWRDSREKFSSLKGSLRWPFVPAEVLHGFGVPDKQATHNSALVHRGVVLKLDRDISEDGVSARSVAWGRVGFAGSIPGYGATVVVDHGRGYHGVYAGVHELKVEEGAVVKPREAVGFFRPGRRKAKLVFELWRDGIPIDPSPWFQ